MVCDNGRTCLQEDGEKTVVLKSEGPDLQTLETKAQSLLLPTFLVEDAGMQPNRLASSFTAFSFWLPCSEALG